MSKDYNIIIKTINAEEGKILKTFLKDRKASYIDKLDDCINYDYWVRIEKSNSTIELNNADGDYYTQYYPKLPRLTVKEYIKLEKGRTRPTMKELIQQE